MAVKTLTAEFEWNPEQFPIYYYTYNIVIVLNR